MQDSKRYNLITLLLFSIIAMISLTTHEMWRDELQAWLIASNSNSFSDLIHNLRYEGHPPLWHILLWLLSKVTLNPVWMKVLHFVIALASVYIINFLSSFNRLQKVLLTFSYYALYEYCVISRNYALGMLGALYFCYIIEKIITNKREYYLNIFVCLCVLFFSNIYSFLIGLCFVPVYLYSLYRIKKLSFKPMLLVLVLGLSALVAFKVTQPSADGDLASNDIKWDYAHSLEVSGSLFKSYLCLPKFGHEFWNSSYVKSTNIQSIYSLVLIGLFAFSFRKNKFILSFYLLSTIGLLLFNYIVFKDAQRHIGNLFIVLISSIWLFKSFTPAETNQRLLNIVFSVVLCFNVVASINAVIVDFRRPFTECTNVRDYIKTNHLEKYPFAGSTDYILSGLSAYFHKPVFYTEINDFGTYIKWTKDRPNPTPEDIMAGVEAKFKNEPVLIIFSQKPYPYLMNKCKFLQEFKSPYVLTDEVYYLYLKER